MTNTPIRIGAGIAAVAGIFLLDAVLGPLFPDQVYCTIGAGTTVIDTANYWRRDSDGRPTFQRDRVCVHGTIWDAIKPTRNR
jgi:hypothetical protein